MLFLIEYDRSRGQLVTFRSFAEGAQGEANEARLELELSMSRLGVAHEVVLLESISEENLRRTHRRYFEDLSALTETRDAGYPRKVAEPSAKSRSAKSE